LPEDVDALFRSTLTRSSGEPEELSAGYGIGYFHLVWNRSQGLSRNILGGSGAVIEALAQALSGRVRTGARATAVWHEEQGVGVRYVEGGLEHEICAQSAVVAAPAYAARRIIHELPADTAAALEAIPYGPYVVGAILTGEKTQMPWDDIYA